MLKAGVWLLLAAVYASIVVWPSFSWLVYAVSASTLMVVLLLIEFEERHSDSRPIVLVAVLVALTVASRQLLHGIEFSPVFFIVILAGYVFGFTTGFAVGALSMFTSNFFLGHGPWTPFQMLGIGLAGAFAAFIPRIRREILPLTVYSVIIAYLYGAVVDVFSWMAFIPAHTLESFIGVLASGMLANTARAVGNVFFMALMGPLFLRVFRRFSRRLTVHRL